MMRWPPLLRDRRGNTLVEFAIVLPVLLVLICGTIDAGYVYMAQTSLSAAVAKAARESASTQEATESDRNAAMEATILQAMGSYRLVPGHAMQISTKVYQNFGNTEPEPFTDVNGNGKYDPGEPFQDRNANGQWDASTPISDSGVGDEGQVVSYSATYPLAHLFGFLSWTGIGITLSANSVTRNEPVKTS